MPAKKTTKKTTAKTTTRKTKTAPKKAALTSKTATKKAAPKTAAKKTVKAAAKTAKTASKTTTKAASNTTKSAINEMEKIMKNQPFDFDKMAQEAANQSREGFEALVKSGTIFAKGFEDIMKVASSMTQDAAEKQAEFARQLMGSKTMNEYAEAQNKIAQANFDQFMSGATQLSEMSVKVLSEASEPLNTQMTKAMNQANKTMAA